MCEWWDISKGTKENLQHVKGEKKSQLRLFFNETRKGSLYL